MAVVCFQAEFDQIMNMDQIPNYLVFGKILYVNLVTKLDEENLILYFHSYMSAFYCVFDKFLAFEFFFEVFGNWYQLFGYLNIFLKISNGPNTEYE